MTKQEFITWAKSRGWTEDKYGHLQKRIGFGTISNLIRFKLSSTAIRYEKQITMSDGKHEWLRLYSGYYKDLRINSKNQLVGLKR